jgi:chaperonin GroEL (HSP60 family)
LQNAGFDDYDIMAELKHAGQGWGFDVIRREKVDMKNAGLYDAATVVKAAVNGAAHAAALALTTDVIIHRRILPEAIDTP